MHFFSSECIPVCIAVEFSAVHFQQLYIYIKNIRVSIWSTSFQWPNSCRRIPNVGLNIAEFVSCPESQKFAQFLDTKRKIGCMPLFHVCEERHSLINGHGKKIIYRFLSMNFVLKMQKTQIFPFDNRRLF